MLSVLCAVRLRVQYGSHAVKAKLSENKCMKNYVVRFIGRNVWWLEWFIEEILITIFIKSRASLISNLAKKKKPQIELDTKLKTVCIIQCVEQTIWCRFQQHTDGGGFLTH